MTGRGLVRSSLPVVVLTLMCFLGSTKQAQAQCTLPADLQSTWYQTDNGRTIVMGSSVTSGQLFEQTTGVEYTGAFDCFVSSGDQYVFVTQTSLSNAFGTTSRVYFCWEMVKVTDVTYLLYDLTALNGEGTFSGQKVKEVVDGDGQPSLAEVCTLTSSTQIPALLYKYPSSVLEPVTMAERLCAPELFHTYSYVKDGSDCSGTDSQLDFCKGRMSARANYTACATKILYSRGGLLSCLANVTIDSTVYQLMLNHDDTVDDSSYYKFVCLKVTTTGEQEEATVHPSDCAATASSHTLTLTRTESCPITDDEGSETDVVPIIVGVLLSILVVVAIVVAVAMIYYFVCLKKKMVTITPRKSLPNGNSVHSNRRGSGYPEPPGENTPNGAEGRRSSKLPPLDAHTPRTEPLRQ